MAEQAARNAPTSRTAQYAVRRLPCRESSAPGGCPIRGRSAARARLRPGCDHFLGALAPRRARADSLLGIENVDPVAHCGDVPGFERHAYFKLPAGRESSGGASAGRHCCGSSTLRARAGLRRRSRSARDEDRPARRAHDCGSWRAGGRNWLPPVRDANRKIRWRSSRPPLAGPCCIRCGRTTGHKAVESEAGAG